MLVSAAPAPHNDALPHRPARRESKKPPVNRPKSTNPVVTQFFKQGACPAPLDLNVDSDGFANFGRAYFPGTMMSVTAPPTSAGRLFVRWRVDGVLQELGVRFLELVITEDTTLHAIYQRQTRLDPERPEEDDGDLE